MLYGVQVITKTGKIVVDGINVKKKTVQPKPGTEEKGQIVQTESPIHHSNVMLYSKEQQVRSRIGHKCVLSWDTLLVGAMRGAWQVPFSVKYSAQFLMLLGCAGLWMGRR